MQKVSSLVSKDIGNYLTNKNTWGGILYNVKAYGAEGDGVTDDTADIQDAINSASAAGGGVIFFPDGEYLVTASLQLPTNVSICGTGHGTTCSIITYTGTGFAIKTTAGHTRNNIENIRINLNFANDGVRIGDAYASLAGAVPGINTLSNITVTGIAAGKYGLHLYNTSHVTVNNVHTGYSSTGGTGLYIQSDTLNTGVIAAHNCVFGRVDATDIGMLIDGNAALDAFTFNACYFGGKTTTVRLGVGAGVVRAAVFNGCHHETKNATGAAVELYNVIASQFNSSSIQGFSLLATAFSFKGPGTTIRRVNIFGTEANAVVTDVFKVDGASIVDECIIQAATKTGGSVATQFSGDFSDCIRYDEQRLRLPTIVPEEIYLGGRKHTYGTAAPTTGTWAQGDVVYNTAPAAAGYIGWTCVSSGTPGTWKGFGTIQA